MMGATVQTLPPWGRWQHEVLTEGAQGYAASSNFAPPPTAFGRHLPQKGRI